MKIILTESIESLGSIGSEVNVAKGYARNYLLPQGKALLSTPENLKRLERDRARFEAQVIKERALAQEMAQRLEGVVCTIAAKVSEEDRLYGSVTVREIADALAAQGLTADKRMILLPEPIKSLGTYRVPVRLYKGVKPEIIVEVVPEA